MNRFEVIQQHYEQTQQEFNKLLDLMEETWGYRPDVSLTPYLAVQADFNIKGFQHDGRLVLVRKRTPYQAARAVASEISSHRNTCAECGEGIASLWMRVNATRYPQFREFYKNQGLMDVPADAVERKLHPVYAKILDEALREPR